MTWHRDTMRLTRRGTGAAAAALATLVVGGCGSKTHAPFLRLLSPEPDAVLTMADDTDPSAPGLQVRVTGEAQGLAQGTQIDVFIDDDQQDDRVGIDDTGMIELQGVTLPPGTHALSLRTSTGSLRSDDQQYTFRALVITAPEDDQTLSLADDEDAAQPGVQISVAVTAHAVEPSEAITLLVDGEPAGGTEMPDTQGTAVFAGVTLPSGEHTLGAVVPGDPPIAAEEITVTVSEACAAINFISPKPAGGRVTLGGAGRCPEGDAPFEISVEVSTDAGDGRAVELFVNGQPVASGEVQGSHVQFDGVALTNLASANRLRVEVMNADGVTCGEDFPSDIFVDCAGPDCTLASPTPIDYVDAKNDLTLFLNAEHENKGGFDIGVATDRAGQKVSLILDRDETSALDLTSTKAGAKGLALFKTVKLAEGEHWIQGRCEDEAGNATFTDEVQWVVDTLACEVEVTAPDADTLFVPQDDDDANPANGTQTLVTSTVGGGDCVAQRAGPCDPASGLANPDFVPYDGTSPLLSTLTLDADRVDQTLCVEIEDQAQNVGRGTLDVRFRGIPPTLEIQSPDDGESFNALGNAGHTADALPASTACDAAFEVACTEVGEPVQLRFGDATGTVFATAPCTAPGPAGFAGRAQVTKAFDAGGQTAVVVATQTIEGDSGETFTGSSASITISGDCAAPAPYFQDDPCEGGFIGIASSGDTVTKNVVVIAGATDATTVTLDVDNTDGTSSTDSTPDTTMSSISTFNNVLLGGAGTVTVLGSVRDDLDNIGTAMCTATIVTDVPTLSVTAPVDNQQFGPGDGCNAGAGVFGVLVTAMADTDVNRTATISVNGGAPTGTTVSGGGGISQCVAVPDDVDQGGPSTITLRVVSTASGAFREVTRTVRVRTVAITDPSANQVLVAGDDCGGTGFAYTVSADVDAAHMGGSYVIGSPTSGTMLGGMVTGGSIGGCLDLAEGPQTIAVSIDGTEYAAVDVVVASTTPSTEIALTPTCPSQTAASYRNDPVHLDWDTLANLEDYPGQFQSYLLRCAHASVATAATPEDWWNSVASDVALGAPPVTPQSGVTAADIPYRVGETRYCALRARDAADQLTPITDAADVTCKFREALLLAPNVASTQAGFDAAAVGDVNGDGTDDVLVGASTGGRAYLVFGTSAAFSGTPDVTFTGASNLGRFVTGLGDFNADGLGDFAISWNSHNTLSGQVFVFFGRPMARPWPPSVDLSASCGADLCIKHASTQSRLGTGLSSAGDFDADGNPDLAVGASEYDAVTSSGDTGRLFVILGDGYEVRTCTGDPDCRANETCAGAPTATCQLMAGEDFWGLDYQLPSGNWLNAPSGTPATLRGFVMDGTAGTVARFGLGIAALGSFDSTAGDDLVVSAPSCTVAGDPTCSVASVSAKLYFLSGRAPASMGGGLQALPFSEIGFRDGGGTPDGQAFETGRPEFFGAPLAAGNVYDDPGGGNPGTVDLIVKQTTEDRFYVYPGDTSFAPADRIDIFATGSDDVGVSLAAGFYPSLPPHPAFPTPDLPGDLDGDGIVEMCAGSLNVGGIAPGASYLWYSDAVAASAGDGALSSSEASRIEPAAAASTTRRMARYIGDLNDDGQPDLLVGDPNAACAAGANCGRATLLY